MTLINSVFDAYIDANILLMFAFTLWILARFALRKSGHAYAFTTQLRLLNGIFFAVALSPFIALSIGAFLQSGLVANTISLNLSDFVLAQYLDGGFEMKPSQLEHMLGLREFWTANLLGLKTTSGMIIAALLAVGSGTILMRTAFSIFRLRRIIRHSFPWRQFGNIHLRLSDTIHVPFSTRSPRNHYIVIPSGMLARSDDLKMALGHEFQHIRQGDIAWEIALELLKPFFFWNPAFIFWKRQVERLRELSCDQQVIRRKGYDVQAYCECLLRACRDGLRKDQRQQIIVPSVALVQVNKSLFGVNTVGFLRQRVASLCDAGPAVSRSKIVRVLMIPLIGIITAMSFAIQEPSDWSHDRLMLSTIVNLERLDVRNGVSD